MNYGKQHFDYCRAHPVRSYLYMMAACFVAVALGHYLHLPRPVYAAMAFVAYRKLTGGL